ncbi:hypothetical protein JCM14202_1420 [Agrilactobacillus composti DSM 18527 = JCM 14202]|nr:hypothetical protein [Agrilactobacillus composti]GAF39554.1 hypothetical protein JCM14202_1420 [Agrilactobacillus composti DSM 18527 = JCM 14202]
MFKHMSGFKKSLTKVSVLGLAVGSIALLSACSGNNTSQSSDASSKTSSVEKSSKSSSPASSKSQSTASQASETTSDSSSASTTSATSSTTTASSSSAASSQSSASSSATQQTITTGDQAQTYLKSQVDAQYQADGPTVYGFTNETTYQGQKAFRVEVGKNNGRSTVAIYDVLENGQYYKVNN